MNSNVSLTNPKPLPRTPSGAINLSPILTGYEGKWVALTDDLSVVVASGNNHDECEESVIAKGVDPESVAFMRVPPKGVKLLYCNSSRRS